MYLDSHNHFLDYLNYPQQYEWMTDRYAKLRSFYGPELFKIELNQHGLFGTIVVQARQNYQETDWLLMLANKHKWILVVVGWMDLSGGKYH